MAPAIKLAYTTKPSATTTKNALGGACSQWTQAQPPAATITSRASAADQRPEHAPGALRREEQCQPEAEQAVRGTDDAQVLRAEVAHRGVLR